MVPPIKGFDLAVTEPFEVITGEDEPRELAPVVQECRSLPGGWGRAVGSASPLIGITSADGWPGRLSRSPSRLMG
jgi:hypothetical protein